MALPTRVLTIDENSIYLQVGRQLVMADARSGESIKSWQLPFTSWQHCNRWLIRLNRLGVQSLIPITESIMVIVENNRIYRVNLESGKVEAVFEDFQGRRPLFMCQALNGDLYFGEYYNNASRDPVRIFASRDQGLTFEKVYTFQKNTIRHVHGIFSDSYSGDIWVTTGDTDQESWIWKTGDGFQSLVPIIGGDQQYRAVQLLFSETHVYFGSDTPLERNHLFRLDRKTGSVETLQEIQGSVFYGAKVGDYLFFSTVVEPSSVNQDKNVYLWGSGDGMDWQVINSFRKDLLPEKLFQYGQIRFPIGENQTGNLWFTPFSTDHDQTLKSFPVEGIMDNQ